MGSVTADTMSQSISAVRSALSVCPPDHIAAEVALSEVTALLRHQSDCLSPDDLCFVCSLADVERTPPLLLTQALRCLRNVAAVSQQHRAAVAADGALLLRLAALLRRRLSGDEEGAVVNGDGDGQSLALAGRIAVQLLGNVVSAVASARKLVWSALAGLLNGLLSAGDNKLSQYTSMLLFNLLKDDGTVTALSGRADFGAVVARLLGLVAAPEPCEWALYCVEALLAAGLQTLVENVPETLLPVLLDVVLIAVERDHLQLSAEDVCFARDICLSAATPLLKLDAATLTNTDPTLLKKLLELIAVLSAGERLRPTLQAHGPTLEMVVNLLRVVHELGKEEGTAFSSLNKLSDMQQVEEGGEDAVSRQSSFGLKALLVRLVGNLTWRCAAAQQAARRLGAIPVVLECCNLDARNPLLQQWAVSAVRHLCEACPENQAEIAGLGLQDLAPAAQEELRQVGVTVVREAGRIRVLPSQPMPPPPP